MNSSIGINEVHIPEADVSGKWLIYRVCRICDDWFCVQKFVQAFLGGSSSLDHARGPSDGTHREGEQGHIHHKFRDSTYSYPGITIDSINAPDHDRMQRAKTNEQ